MNPPGHIDIPHGDEVTTEPQRLALEAMSHDLVVKLNMMVAEQEQRAHDFAAHQHSLSSLPAQMTPELTQVEMPKMPSLPEVQSEAPTTTRGVKARMASPQTPPQPQSQQASPSAPQLPPMPTPQVHKKQAEWQPYGPQSQAERNSSPYRMPTIIREPKEKKEGTIGAGTISVIIFIILILLMHGCE